MLPRRLGREIERALSAAVGKLNPLRGQVSATASQTIDRVLEHLARAAKQLRQRAE